MSTADSENAKWWPVLYVGKFAAQEQSGSYVWKLRQELSDALDAVDLSAIPLYKKKVAAFWKISHGTVEFSEEEFAVYAEKGIVSMSENTKALATSKTSQGEDFVKGIKSGDYFYLCRGNSVRLLGRFISDAVEPCTEKGESWVSRRYEKIATSSDTSAYDGVDKWWTPNHNSTCVKVKANEEKLFEETILLPYFGKTIRQLLNGISEVKQYDRQKFLDEVFMDGAKYDEMVAVLRYKKNIILQGAPGVGKTFAAKRLAYSMMGEVDEDRVEFVQFHQSYSYEDFVMGYKPNGSDFLLKEGVFYTFCKKAASHPDQEYFFIIDEINRGNLSKIFGELLMAIEKDYRAPNGKVTLAYRGESFAVPENLYIIGMMNTADRSLAMIDYALRRRFSFFTMEPGFESDGFKKYQQSLHSPLFDKVIEKIVILNKEIAADKSLGKGFCIGHSYFYVEKAADDIGKWLKSVVVYDVLPMLEEYWFDEEDTYKNKAGILLDVFNGQE